MRSLGLDKTVVKELSELPAKQYRQVVSAIFDLLKDPLPYYSRPLSGSAYLRIAVGEYRVIYRFDDRSVTVLAFGKRNDGEIYQVLKKN
ncbi:MAG TPA: type II toxin-antitoxin system RelE/ParE family toxin [Tepidisphaeraceae bacterium]|jgi:mRNA interferase RelE/StbE|nr:type II toxin-antitoxin system RelE/ParE family toxin [Tepidisphaeraceae bacterium]